MEKFMCFLMPMALLLKFFITKKESTIEYVRKYFSLCFINNLLCAISLAIYNKEIVIFKETFDFFIKYSILALVIGILMVICYKMFKDLVKVKIEVVHEKSKRK